jgi:hypothetical protein
MTGNENKKNNLEENKIDSINRIIKERGGEIENKIPKND